MAKNRTFQDGISVVNGYEINIIRFVGAQQVSATSRHAARHWGTITTPDGDVISMGDAGMTTPDIKKIVGMTETKVYNRGSSSNGGGSSEINKLMKLKSSLESMGLPTADVEAKIEQIKAEQADKIEADRLSAENQKKVKQIQKEIKKLEKLVSQTESLGVDASSIKAKIALMYVDIEALMDGNPID